MKRPTLICLLSLLCALPPTAAHSQQTPSLTFTLETKDKLVQLYEPLAIRVVLRNNSQSTVSLNTKHLRLSPNDWHVVGTWGQWSGTSEGMPLKTENGSSGKIELAPGSSLRLLTTNEFTTFELLGPTRVSYILSSSDAATKQLLSDDGGDS